MISSYRKTRQTKNKDHMDRRPIQFLLDFSNFNDRKLHKLSQKQTAQKCHIVPLLKQFSLISSSETVQAFVPTKFTTRLQARKIQVSKTPSEIKSNILQVQKLNKKRL